MFNLLKHIIKVGLYQIGLDVKLRSSANQDTTAEVTSSSNPSSGGNPPQPKKSLFQPYNPSKEREIDSVDEEEKIKLSHLFDYYYKTFSDLILTKGTYFFGQNFFRQLLMVDTIRYFFVLARYIYFVEFLNNLKIYQTDNENIRQDIDGNQGTAEYNIPGILNDLGAARSLRLIKPLSVIESYRTLGFATRGKGGGGMLYDLNCPCDAKLLAIGPRTEGEILCLIAHGFRPDNIRGLDLISYSPWIDLGDMHAIPHEESTWDIVLLSMVLTYSEDPPNVVEEAVRVVKNGGLIGVSLDNDPKSKARTSEKYGYPLACAADILKLFGNWVDRIYFSNDLPEMRRNDEIYTASVIFSVRK